MMTVLKSIAAALFAVVTTAAIAQTEITSLNVLTPTVNAWSGSVAGQNGGYSGGGNGPAYNVLTDTLIFGYTTATATQRVTSEAFAIQHALDLSNSGIKINGYNYSWYINNSGEQSGTLSGQVNFLRGTSVLRTDIYNYNAPTNGFELRTGTQTFANQESMLAGDSMTLSFTGKDSRFWAGYYGPQVRQPSITLNYTTDPCLSNPAYSPSCPGYNTVVTSGNLLSGMTGTQAYAINQALSFAGAGATIHGFDYGYNYNVAGRQCAIWDLFGLCLTGYNYSDAGVATVITDSNNATIYSESNTHNGGNNGTSGTYSRQYRFNSSLPMSTLGGFAMSPWTLGNASITNMYSNAVYTADPCLANPLSSPSCPGYAAAYLTQQCTANPLYDSSCPGYAQAFFTQQCTANQLYNPACPGYAAAYLNYQCSVNPLYATQCPGYAEAYFNQQCKLDSLFSNKCEGYATAYAIKYLTPISSDSTVANAVNGSLSDTAAVKANDPANTKVATNTVTTTVNTDGSVSTGVSTTGDTNVDKAITAKASTTNTAPAAVQLAPPPPPAQQQMAQNEPKGGGNKSDEKRSNDKQEERKKDDPKTESASGGQGPMAKSSGPSDGGDKDRPKTARQEIQEKREAAAKAKAVEEGKQLAGKMGDSVSMEQQIAVQNVVLQAMGFTPGFDVYNRAIMPDAVGYRPFEIYRGQRNIDTPSSRRLLSGSDRLHTEMIDQQYNRGQ
jgi:hypothetical protein